MAPIKTGKSFLPSARTILRHCGRADLAEKRPQHHGIGMTFPSGAREELDQGNPPPVVVRPVDPIDLRLRHGTDRFTLQVWFLVFDAATGIMTFKNQLRRGRNIWRKIAIAHFNSGCVRIKSRRLFSRGLATTNQAPRTVFRNSIERVPDRRTHARDCDHTSFLHPKRLVDTDDKDDRQMQCETGHEYTPGHWFHDLGLRPIRWPCQAD